MNIVLLNPPYFYKVVREGRCQHEAAIWDSVYPPLSLATLASFLRDRNDVVLIDAIAEGMDLPALLKGSRRGSRISSSPPSPRPPSMKI